MILKDAAWSSNYVLGSYSRLPYERVATTDAVESAFNRLCIRLSIKCEWFPYAGALSFDGNPATLKTLCNLREEAIDQVKVTLENRIRLRSLSPVGA